MAGLSYRDAGVSIEAQDALVSRIKKLAARTRIAEQVGEIGGFAGLCGLPRDMREPLLVSGTDGVGTKLLLAFMLDVHDTVGIDLVAMCVNDVITCGARPLFFLDYLATGRLDVDRAEKVVQGIVKGCELAGCALLGGETAELPGLYRDGEYDLAGFAVGVVERDKILDGSKAQPGDQLIGVASSGLHSNGYSLARKALLERGELELDAILPDLGEPLAAALLRPTRIYVRAVANAIAAGGVKALCHITGGGMTDNLPRVLPVGLEARIDPGTWAAPPIFDLVARHGSVTAEEMRRTFNMGVGMVAVVTPERSDDVLAALAAAGEEAWTIGELTESAQPEQPSRVEYL